MRRSMQNRHGFTMMEVIITLVVLAILAAVMIPAMTGWIDESKAKTCEANRKSLLENFAAYRVTNGIKAMSANNASFLAFERSSTSLGGELTCPEGGVYSYIDGKIVCTKHTDGAIVPNPVENGVYAALCEAKTDSGNPPTNIDSCSTKGGARKEALAALEKLNIDPVGMDMISWGLTRDTKTNKIILLWTDVDIATLKAGAAAAKSIPVLRYNSEAGTYTVFLANVQERTQNGETYNVLTEGKEYKESAALGKEEKKSYEQAVEWYRNALATYEAKNPS